MAPPAGIKRAALAAVLMLAPAARAQSAYDAASIKRSAGDPRQHALGFQPGGRFRSINVPLLPVLGIAYDIPFQSVDMVRLRIHGLPDWMGTEPYDLEVTPAKGWAPPNATAKVRNQRLRLMLQSVLADRLQLRIRRDTTEMPVYAVRVGPHGPKLERSKLTEADCGETTPFSSPGPDGPGCHQFQGGVGRGLLSKAVDLSDLALYVSNWSELPIVDQTGLTGLYAIKTEGWNTRVIDDPSRPSLDEIFERLGLKLERKKAPVEILMIEHVERPSGN